MNGILRHLSVRLWMTLLLGGPLLLVLMPLWQRAVGMAWLALPVTGVLAGCFALIGWAMNRRGAALIERLMAEAAVWERAGMAEQAEDVFERVRAAFDSFWLSPLRRRAMARRITRRLARFHLSRSEPGEFGCRMVATYLRLHPTDAAVAAGWLEQVRRMDEPGPEVHALAERIGAALPDVPTVQRDLMAFYLSAERSDYEALQTYRRVWHRGDPIPDAWVVNLARLLRNEHHINDWALQVYLKGYALGDHPCLEGIAAGHSLLRPHADNQADLAAAREALGDLDAPQREALLARFRPPAPEVPSAVDVDQPPPTARGRGPLVVVATAGKTLAAFVTDIGRRVRPLARAMALRRAVGVAVLVAVLGVAAALGWHWAGTREAPAPPPPEPVAEVEPPPPPVTDPFTIQVAAYLRPDDAQRYVDRLKQQNIDAFSTKAVSGSRTWYQVKVSHFATRDQARRYGEQLKTKGLIDDFYVANYQP